MFPVLPLTPPASPPTKLVSPPALPKGLRKKKAKKRKTCVQAGRSDSTGGEPSCRCDLDISDLCHDAPPSAELCTLIRTLMVHDLLAASRAVTPCREITIHVPLLAIQDEPQGPSSKEVYLYRAQREKQRLLALHGVSQLAPLGSDHSTCPLGKCGVKRCLLWDTLMDGEMRDVRVKMHIQPSLVQDLALPPFTMSFKLHVHVDDITGSAFICAPELVRALLPRFFGSLEKRMHSLYTLNHPFGRGIPRGRGEDDDAVLAPDVWKKWAGCPRALQGRKCDPDEGKTRIWLLDDGTAEVSLGAECEPDESTIAPPINSSKGKSRAC